MTIANRGRIFNDAPPPRGPPTLCYIENLGNLRGFKLVSREGLAWLECRKLGALPWLLHAFSTRRGGVSKEPVAGLNLGYVEADQRANVEANRKLFFEHIGAQSLSLAALRQIHSSAVYQVVRKLGGELEYRPAGYPAPPLSGARRPLGDALVTDQPGILLSVRSADCLPILLVDPRRPAVAAVHAGWRGALHSVIEKTVGVMRALFSSDPQHVLAALGPCIHACCYEVGQEVVDGFGGAFVNGERFFCVPTQEDASRARPANKLLRARLAQPPGRALQAVPAPRLDLVAVAQDQLRRAGILAANIQVNELCTACRADLFFSHRRDGRHAGRVMAVIGIRPEQER